jgi:putative flippase GtrA
MSRPLSNQFLKFGTVGALGFIVDAGFLQLGMHALRLSPIHAALFAYPFAVTFTWIGNRYLTFRQASRQPALKQWAAFAVACTFGLAFNRGTFILLVMTVPFIHYHPSIALLAGAATGMLVNFLIARTMVFKPPAQRG